MHRNDAFRNAGQQPLGRAVVLGVETRRDDPAPQPMLHRQVAGHEGAASIPATRFAATKGSRVEIGWW